MANAKLTTENFENGFLVDDQLMAGVTKDPEQTGRFVAFVLRPESGEYLGYQSFDSLAPAIEAINAIPREWAWEGAGGCGSCAEGMCGVAAGGACRKKTVPSSESAPSCGPCASS